MNVAVTETNGVAEYDEFRAKINEVKEACDFIPDVSTDEGYDKSKRISLDVGKVLTALEKKRKELKAESLEFGRKIDAEAKSIAGELSEFQLPHKQAYKELDDLRKQREAERKAQLQERVDNLQTLPEVMRDSSSEEVKAALENVMAEECLDFYEFTEQALKARNSAKEALSNMFKEKLQQETERAELERLRREQEERAQRDREERIAKEAADKAEREAAKKIDAERQARAEVERKAEEDRRLAEQKAIEAKQRAEREVREAAERALKEREEEENRAREEEAARRADEEHRLSVHSGILEALTSRCSLTAPQAENVVAALSRNEVPFVQINY